MAEYRNTAGYKKAKKAIIDKLEELIESGEVKLTARTEKGEVAKGPTAAQQFFAACGKGYRLVQKEGKDGVIRSRCENIEDIEDKERIAVIAKNLKITTQQFDKLCQIMGVSPAGSDNDPSDSDSKKESSGSEEYSPIRPPGSRTVKETKDDDSDSNYHPPSDSEEESSDSEEESSGSEEYSPTRPPGSRTVKETKDDDSDSDDHPPSDSEEESSDTEDKSSDSDSDKDKAGKENRDKDKDKAKKENGEMAKKKMLDERWDPYFRGSSNEAFERLYESQLKEFNRKGDKTTGANATSDNWPEPLKTGKGMYKKFKTEYLRDAMVGELRYDGPRNMENDEIRGATRLIILSAIIHFIQDLFKMNMAERKEWADKAIALSVKKEKKDK